MNKLLFILLILAIAVQCSGLADLLHKTVAKMDLCADDTSPGEESQQDELKKDDDQIGLDFMPEAAFECPVRAVDPFSDFNSAGFSSNLYLPPRC